MARYSLTQIHTAFHIVDQSGNSVEQHAEKPRALRRLKLWNSIDTGPIPGDGDADLSVLGKSIKDLIKALASGKHDHVLGELIKAETNGDQRSGALIALSSRLAAVAKETEKNSDD